jgi:hypothetical protein
LGSGGHPRRLGGAWSGFVTRVWVVAVAIGLFVFILVGLLWREGGPAYRWRQRMLRTFPSDPPRRS